MSGSSWRTATVVVICCLVQSTVVADPKWVGSAVDVLTNFGDLYLKFRVSPRNDSNPWVFYDDPSPVLKDASVKRTVFYQDKGEFRLELCDDFKALMESYFRHFFIEGVENAWKAFALSWSSAKQSSSFGIKSPRGDHGFIVLKLNVQKEKYHLQRLSNLNQSVQALFDQVSIYDTMSAIKFYQQTGTHYIHSYSTGNSLCQVLVYERQVFENLKKRIHGPVVPATNFAAMAKYLSPLYANEVGRVMVASGDLTIARWANEILRRKRSRLKTKYPSLWSVMWRPWIVEEFTSRTGPDAVVGLRLELIDRVVSADEEKKKWYHMLADNFLKLNENNA
ncbi:torso-like protein [Nesidiocoris tenuis]|uniref:Torso-like protein n=1 Tax=Nesidiocoris tenuis TaxID=355587 RepID=A0ABN7AL96_9HEMI|nr:torso-like protein [Nesidiocoris tenuis]